MRTSPGKESEERKSQESRLLFYYLPEISYKKLKTQRGAELTWARCLKKPGTKAALRWQGQRPPALDRLQKRGKES